MTALAASRASNEAAAPSTSERRRALTLAGAALGGAALLATVDPNQPGHYPACPTQAIFGIDCPACGTLRGLHALLHGHVATAVDHNLLLLVAVPLAAIALVLTLRPLVGRPSRAMPLPSWALPASLAIMAVFAVIRNLPGDPFSYLASGA